VKYLRPMLFGGPVLEIGSGHRPYPQSHVLVDKFLDDREREGTIATSGRPLVVAGLEALPFRDGAFAYSICSHVLEHVADPARAVAELVRVSRAGYIETPSAIFEMIEPHREYHRWVVSRRGCGLLVRPKDRENLYRQRLLNRLVHGNTGFKIFVATNQNLKKTILEWEGTVPLEFTDEPFHPDEYVDAARQSAGGALRNVASLARDRTARKCASALGRFRRRFDIGPLLRCPDCGGELSVGTDRVECRSCGASHRREGNVYHLSGAKENDA